MSYFPPFEEVLPVQLNAVNPYLNNEELCGNFTLPFFHQFPFNPPRVESDPTEQLVDKVGAISFGSPAHVHNLQLFSRSPNGEPIARHGSSLSSFGEGCSSATHRQESFLIQPYPFTPVPDQLHRHSSPIETISSDSSQVDNYGQYATSNIDSEYESNGSPAMPLFEDFGYFEHCGSQAKHINHAPFCSLSEIQSIPDEEQDRFARFLLENDHSLQEMPLKEDYSFEPLPFQSSYEDPRSFEEKISTVVRIDALPDFLSDDEKDSDYTPNPSRVRRSSRTSTKQHAQSLARTKVTKRAPSKTPATHSAKAKQNIQNALSSAPESADTLSYSNPFSCPLTPYGCRSTFKSKNEWKRHIISRHLYLGFWRCDCCPDSDARPNDFNRKDLFTQHLRRMHHPQKDVAAPIAPKSPPKINKTTKVTKHRTRDGVNAAEPTSGDFEDFLEQTRKRCWIGIRKSPTKAFCVFCDETFEGEGGFEAWLEHAGRHLSGLAKQSSGDSESTSLISGHQIWLRDTIFRDWLLDQGFLQVNEDGQLSLVDDETAHIINMQQLQTKRTN